MLHERKLLVFILVCVAAACSGGTCDLCEGTCNEGEVCVDGQCVEALCARVVCSDQEVCLQGVCYADLPDVPVPSSSNADAPLRSASVFAVMPLQGDFVARTTSGNCTWELGIREKWCNCDLTECNEQCVCADSFLDCGDECPDDFADICDQSAEITDTVTAHSDELMIRGKSIAGEVVPWMAVYQEGGELIDPRAPGAGEDSDIAFHVFSVEPCAFDFTNFCGIFKIDQFFYTIEACDPATELVHLQRERFWERVPVNPQGELFLRLTGNTERSVSTSYRSGSSTTQIEEFAISVTAELQVGPEFFQATVSATLGATFGTERTITEETEVTLTDTVRGSEGTITIFLLWELVERYTFTDAQGNPYTHPSATLVDLSVLEIRGVASALEATQF